MMTINDVLNSVVENDDSAMIVRPATPEDLEMCLNDMSVFGFIPLPEGYTAFLSMLNGFAWNGIEFFSTDQVTDPETDYTLMDIVTANEGFAEANEDYPETRNYVLLGRADDDLFVYSIASKLYEIIDMSGRDVMESFETFDALFVAVVAPRI